MSCLLHIFHRLLVKILQHSSSLVAQCKASYPLFHLSKSTLLGTVRLRDLNSQKGNSSLHSLCMVLVMQSHQHNTFLLGTPRQLEKKKTQDSRIQ
jgi:hypothetical protein